MDEPIKNSLSPATKTAHSAMLDQLTTAEIEATMDDCDALGEEAFLQEYGYATPRNWVHRPNNGRLYPAKAVVAIALGKRPNGVALHAKAFFDGFGEAQSFETLKSLNYEIVKHSKSDGFPREDIEAAMDAFDAYQSTRQHAEIFDSFGDAKDYWVRSTKARPKPVYPTKPLVGFMLNKTVLNGGWSQKRDAAALLHNAGYLIVDSNDTPIEVPEQYSYLMRGADRIRHFARNYFIEPAREQGEGQISIAVREISNSLKLDNWFPVICNALGKPKFQELADVAAPSFTTPNPSSTTIFTFQLAPSLEQRPMQDNDVNVQIPTTNLILYGPPGTGKTYTTAQEAVRLCGEDVPEDRDALMARYNYLAEAGRIEFVTFHQSISYEEFVEGRQPVTGPEEDGPNSSGGFRLETVPGIFRRISKRAENSRSQIPANDATSVGNRQVYKMSIGSIHDPNDVALFDGAIQGGYTLLSWEDINWSDPKYADQGEIIKTCQTEGKLEGPVTAQSGQVSITDTFRNRMSIGDFIVVSKGNSFFRAIGEVVGDYEYHPRPEGTYGHRRAVRWLWVDSEGAPVDEIYRVNFTQRSMYKLEKAKVKVAALERLINNASNEVTGYPEPFVLIIDEINRANISKVFGELITLLETDKRLGQPNALRVRLPYSGEDFGVPSNLHIIGTMNTADRSIALLDTALRRRFTFREMMPRPEVLANASQLSGRNLGRILTTINERIEYLHDREHQIGHAYFTGCTSAADVDDVMRDKVIPLLAEYFFEDWAKIAAVLGDLETHEVQIAGGFLNRSILPPPPGLDDGDAMPRFRWEVRPESQGFDYAKLLST